MRSIQREKQTGQNINRSKAMLRNTQNNTGCGGGTLNYIEVKQLLNDKKGKLTDGEIKLLVKD